MDYEKIDKIIIDLINHNNKINKSHIVDSDNVCVGLLSMKSGQLGCIKENDGWYFYKVYDYNDVELVGPFSDKGIIKAIAHGLNIVNDLEFLKFTDEEFEIYYNDMFTLKEFQSKGK